MSDLSIDRAVHAAIRRALGGAGTDVVRQREDAGLTRAELAKAARVDPSYLRRIEAGMVSPSIKTYARLASALGSDLSLRLYPNTGPTIHDRHQTPILESLLKVTHPRWRRYLEIPVRSPARGWIDAGLYDAKGTAFVAVEIQSEIRRIEQLLRWSSEKAASLPSWLGWQRLDPVPGISQLLIVRDTRTTRMVANEFRRTLSVAFPGDPDDALEALAGTATWPGSAILWAKEMEGDRGFRIFARR